MRVGGSLLIGILFASVLGWWMSGAIGTVSSEEPCKCDVEKPLLPPDHSVLVSGTVNVICQTTSKNAKLTIDGRVQDWESFQPPLRVSRLTLSPGIYELRIGNYRSEFCVAMNPEEYDAPSNWKLHYSHPMPNEGEKRCAGCHEIKRGDNKAFTVGELKSREACFKCHESVEFKEIHDKPLEPATLCGDCHRLHDSDRDELLKASVKKSSKQAAAGSAKSKCP